MGFFNDTPVLIGTNSDEGAAFVSPGVTGDQFAAMITAGYGDFADAILAVYPHRRGSVQVRQGHFP
jgi:para-nitrobenzyl esterase